MTYVEALTKVLHLVAKKTNYFDMKAVEIITDLKVGLMQKFKKGDIVKSTLCGDSDPYQIEFLMLDLETLTLYYESDDRSYSYSADDLELIKSKE